MARWKAQGQLFSFSIRVNYTFSLSIKVPESGFLLVAVGLSLQNSRGRLSLSIMAWLSHGLFRRLF